MMRKIAVLGFLLFNFLWVQSAHALLSLELTQGVGGAVPINILPFTLTGKIPSQDVSAIITHDLSNSGRFQVKTGAVDNVVTGTAREVSPGRYQISFQLKDGFNGKLKSNQPPVLSQTFTVAESELRPLAHHISDKIYQQIIGVRGIFSTRLAYVVVQRSPSVTHYVLEVCDQDGYNPRPLLTSVDPIMSPSWSPDAHKLAYVSFENKHASIYIQDLQTGGRQLLTSFPGINGAPSWSPDGRKLALVLSKTNAPNIYVMDLGSKQLTQLTHDYYINTEPAWSKDGRSIIFTSNRSGKPQIYQMNLATREVARVTYEGNYNARAGYTPDGNHIVVLNQQASIFNIGILDLNNGVYRILSDSKVDSDSPSIAPNGSMVLYGTLYGGRSVLAMVATDGSVQIRLPARNGEVQDPAWSPFLG